MVCSEEREVIEGIPLTFTNGSCHDLEDVNKGASLRLHSRLLIRRTLIIGGDSEWKK